MENHWRRQLRPIVVALVLALAGCGEETVPSGVTTSDFSSLRAMAQLYDLYRSEHRGKSPPDEQAFREFLATKTDFLGRVGLTVDKVFVSPRNGEPLQWVYGEVPPTTPSGMLSCYAYEKTPVDGKRLVFGPRGVYELMDDTEFQSVFPDTP
jgi:hypothetical protein